MIFLRFPIDYGLVGERDGFAGRLPDNALWRKSAYSEGYAKGLLARAAHDAVAPAGPALPENPGHVGARA